MLATEDKTINRQAITILVNGRRKVVPSNQVSYDEILALAFDPVPSGPNFVFTITYENIPARPHEGFLRPGRSVEVQEGTRFDVTATDNS